MFYASCSQQILSAEESQKLVHSDFVIIVLLTPGFLSLLNAVCSVHTAFEAGRFCWPVKQHVCMFFGKCGAHPSAVLFIFFNFSQLILKAQSVPIKHISMTY